MELNPRLANTWGNRALALLVTGRLDEAERSIDRCRRLGGKIDPAIEEMLRRMLSNLNREVR